ncbi:MAG: queuosine precursor transporter [Thermoflexibacter sp.]|nr:queuosine precursor transporter [Thermoflexibacter sp.]
METANIVNQKKTHLFIVLCGIFLTNAILAEIVGVKIFSLEATLGLPPAQIPILGSFLDYNLSAGVMMWPVVFITTDIINEYFGKAGVRKISILTVVFIIYIFLMLWAITSLAPAQFWLDLNNKDALGNPLNIDDSFRRIFSQSMGIIIGSLTAFIVGQMLDVTVFQGLRKITGSRKIWLRATGSTIISQLVDSFVVITIAFYIFGNPKWTIEEIISVGTVGYSYKFLIAVLMTPILYISHFFIEIYLGKENSHKIAEQASKTNFFNFKESGVNA